MSSPPPRPAQAALTTKASVCVAADLQPAQGGRDLIVAHGTQRAPDAAVDQVVEREQHEERARAGDPGLPALEREVARQGTTAGSAG